ncbi:hypothetical protein D3C87_144250 [compost metagenome]
MRSMIVAISLLISSIGFAKETYAPGCAKHNQPRYVAAITAVAKSLDMTYEELCALPKIMDVEAQPTHTFKRDGERIPHVRVQLHMAYESCLYMVRDADLEITDQRCYSGF